ncbi:MAG TPA: hypothetical protein VLM89_02590 [Phycisphaerae bacterium]|nr:hypothetical protein [Phycisphaerae bacterium]
MFSTKGCRNCVVKTMGSARDPEDLRRLVELGKLFIVRRSKQLSLFPADRRDSAYRHSRKILRRIQVVFYDMTSLYFLTSTLGHPVR